MKRTITHLFDTYDDAQLAVGELERLRVPHHDISLVAHNADHQHDHRGADGETAGQAAADDAGKGAVAGGVLGAAGGVLAGLGLLAIPGVGPVVAAGWLVTAAVGAVAGAAVGGATGGIVGALTHAGVSEADANVYAEGVRRGGALVSAKVDEDQVAAAEAAMTRLAAVDITSRGEAYHAEGWRQFDESAPAYAGDDLIDERARYGVR